MKVKLLSVYVLFLRCPGLRAQENSSATKPDVLYFGKPLRVVFL